MKINFLAITTALLSVSQAYAALETRHVVVNIDSLAALSANTNDAVPGLDNPVVAAPKIIAGFKNIAIEVNKDVDAMKRGPEDPYKRTEQSDICDAFRKFVKVHPSLLNTVIGKQGMFAATPFTTPVAATTRALKTSADALADEIIDEVPTCAGKAKSDASDLDDTLEKALNAYA